MNRLPRQTIDEIIKLYQEGMTPKLIGEKYNIYNNSVTRILKREGVERNQHSNVDINTQQIIIDRYVINKESSEKIAEDLNLDGSTVCRVLKRNNISIRPATDRRKYDIDLDFFENIDKEEKAYFLGFLYADGHILSKGNGVSITLQEDDKEILEQFSKLIYGSVKLTNQEHNLKNNKIGKYINLAFYGEKIHSDLIKWGCTSKKTFTITFPNNLPNNMYRHFIRGFFDGDGCISINKDGATIIDITSNEDFLKGLSDYLVTNENIKFTNIYNKISNTETNTRFMQSKSISVVNQFMSYLYKDSSIFIKRKYNKYLEFKKINKNKINKNGEKYIPKKDDLVLTSENIKNIENKEEVKEFIFNFYRDEGFPYPNYSNEELVNDFYNLKNIDMKSLINQDNDKIIYTYNLSGCYLFKHNSHHFYHVKNKSSKPSMAEAFLNDDILKSVIQNRIDGGYNISGNMLLQGLANSYSCFKSSIFLPSVAKHIYEKYGKENDIIYDYSMGFGQRLIGALSLPFKVKYIGIDPMEESIEAGLSIEKFVKNNIPNVKTEVELTKIGSENYCPEEYINKVDLAFSSPPYFDLEIYEEDISQANFGSYFDFITKYWNKTVINLSQLIKKDGLLILNMTEKLEKYPILSDMEELIISNGFEKIDTLSLKLNKNNSFRDGKDKFEPIVVYKKL